ncbi:MAG: CapA family protein [Prevotellaceae bacterium]|nr:CapA family protein [Prevotellaceae bacterium]
MQKIRKTRNLFLLSLIVLTGFMLSCGARSQCKPFDKSDTVCDSVADTTSSQSIKILTLAFVGDVMMGTNFPDNSYITKDRGKSLFADSREILRKADLAIANHEGTIYDGAEGELRKMTNPRTYYIFRTPGDHVANLVDAGFDVVGIANNHSNDFGITGRKLTLKTLREAGLGVSGIKGMAEECVVERKGVKCGYLQFAAACTNTLDLNNFEEVDRYIAALRPKCDVLIVGFHGGAEGAGFTHVPKTTEYYVGEKRGDVVAFAHRCIDKGADVVVGHGPHVPRALELYKDKIIAYSLGNFCTPYRMSYSGACGLAPLLTVEINADNGTFSCGRIYSFRQQRGVGPRLDPDNAAARLMKSLTETDFPEANLWISEEGDINKQ